MKKLLIITTGGTIASGNSAGGALAPEKTGRELVPELEGITTDILDLFAIDSTDLTPAYLRKIHHAVVDAMEEYDGIVILHGTDTMAYTGAVLAFTVPDDIPVILTGSMLPYGAENSDAYENIRLACATAANESCAGVWLAFGQRIIRGADITKVNSGGVDAFRSFSGFKAAKKYPFPEDGSDCIPSIVKLTPFTRAASIVPVSENGGIVIETYGAGGLPAGEITERVRQLAMSYPVIITTSCLGGTDLSKYEVGRRALDAGAIDGSGMSTECAAVLVWLLSCYRSS